VVIQAAEKFAARNPRVAVKADALVRRHERHKRRLAKIAVLEKQLE